MKILFFTRRFWPNIGGVEKHVMEVGKRLVKMGHEVTVVSESSTSEESRSLPRHHPRCLKAYCIPVRASEKFKKFQIWWWLWNHRGLIREADIVHCHDVFYWYLPFRLLYPNKKVFTTFHGWEGRYPPRLKAKIIRKISEKMSFGNICVGDYITKWYGTKADCITYGGVANSPRRSPRKASQRGRHGFSLDFARDQPANIRGDYLRNVAKIKINFIGRLEEDTGLPIYLQALKNLKEKGIETEVVFLGDGKWRNEAKKFGKVVGFVKDIGIYLGDSRFVFTSGYLSILEAMVNKRLVFAVYDNPLKKDYLLMAPFSHLLAVADNADDLAKEVWYYLKHTEKEKKFITDAYKWVKEQTWEKLTDQYLQLWRK